MYPVFFGYDQQRNDKDQEKNYRIAEVESATLKKPGQINQGVQDGNKGQNQFRI
jgi:hypothetical protein